MRLAVAALIAFGLPIGFAAAQTSPPQGAAAAPAPARSPQNTAPQQGNTLGSPEHQRQGEQTLQTKSGQNAKEEPGTKPAAANEDPPFRDGKLNAPGAPADSQTVPAKFSERNAAIDKKPILGFIELTREQRRAVLDAVKATDAPVVSSNAKVTEELPSSVALHDLPLSVMEQAPELRDLKFVRLERGILLVYSPSWFVVGEVKE